MLGRVSSLVRVDSAQQRLTPSLEVECASICFSSVLLWFVGHMSTSTGLLARKKTDRRPDPGKPHLMGKTCEDVRCLGVAHQNTIFGLQADCTGPGDSYYPIRALPLRRQLVGILGRLNAPKKKVAFLKASGMNLAAMVAAQGLLVASGLHSSLKTIFLKEQRVVLSQLFLLKLIISEHSR